MDKEREEQPPPTVGAVVGANLRELRKAKRWTQDAAADRVAGAGLGWKRTHIADLESGRRETVDLGTLVILGSVFDVPLQELLAGDGDVLLTPRTDFPTHTTTSTREQLRAWLSGSRYSLLVSGEAEVKAALEDLRREVPVQADSVLAKRLNMPLMDVVNAARGLWGRSLTEERDRRVAELGDLSIGERQARQGHITRELNTELTKWIDEGEAEDG